MTPTRSASTTLRHAALWLLWAASLALLTYALLSPKVPKAGEPLIPSPLRFWVSKATHVGAYAYLSALVAFLPVAGWAPARLRLVLVAHGAATEWLQTFTGRHGSVTDVLIDSAGIALGWALTSLWRRRSGRRRPSPPPPSTAAEATPT